MTLITSWPGIGAPFGIGEERVLQRDPARGGPSRPGRVAWRQQYSGFPRHLARSSTPHVGSRKSARLTGVARELDVYARAMDAGTHPRTDGTRVLLAHKESMVRDALRDLVVQGLGMRVAGEADDLRALEPLARSLRPDLVIVAWDLVSGGAAAALSAVRRSCGGRIVVLGPRPEMRSEALAAGGDAYISMVDAPDVVAASLRPAWTGRLLSHDATHHRPDAGGDARTNEPGELP